MNIFRYDETEHYSQVVTHERTAYVSGQIAATRDGDIAVQAREVFAKIDALLAMVGTTKARLLSIHVWLKTFDDYAVFNQVYDLWVEANNKPARATVRADLLDPRLRIEIAGVAACTSQRATATTSSAQRVADARATIRQVEPKVALSWVGNRDYVFVDVREAEELTSGRIPDAVHAPRGTLEFTLDADSESHIPRLGEAKRLVFVCGSGARAALATRLARDFGYDAVCLAGGFKGWKLAGGPVEPHTRA